MGQQIRLLILDHATMDGRIVPLEQFIADNADDNYLCDQVTALHFHEGITVGGGAAPAISISRWS